MTPGDESLPAVETDVLVLGGGIAGHRAAAAARQRGRQVHLAYLARGASPYIIGCNAPFGHVDARDGPEVYFDDMIRGGYGLNDTGLVRRMADEATAAIDELRAIGVPFACDGAKLRQRHLSGNTYPRSVYIPEGTGRVILEHLARQCRDLGVDTLAGWKAISLLRDGDDVVGALLVRPQERQLVAVRARAVVLAMGGIGRIYADSTYPADVAADAYALAFDAGARLIDMEFVQFEPVVTVWPGACRGMEMPTAMLGDGATLHNAVGERFMFRHNPEHGEKRIEKARLSLAIQREIDEGRGLPDGTVLFDTTRVPPERLESYVSHVKRLRAAGLEPTREGPHVRPAAHSQMGGVAIDDQGWAGVPGLYAAGESAGGVHGASRLAGNGGSDTVVTGAMAGRGAAASAIGLDARDWPRIVAGAVAPLLAAEGRRDGAAPDEIKGALRAVMARSAGIWRRGDELAQGRRELLRLQAAVDAGLAAPGWRQAVRALEARNMVLAARLVIDGALARCESRGAHQRLDWPEQDDAHWRHHIAFRQGPAGELLAAQLPIQ
jgi:succinate dehydrogenase/fumarate reductase flavoprotein subunit